MSFEYINVKKNPAELQRMLTYSKGRRAVPVLLPGRPGAAGAGASEPLRITSGGQAELMLGPYEVIHAVAADR